MGSGADPETQYADAARDAFDTSGTIGVEEEFYIVDDDGHPTAGIDDLVYGSEPPAVLEGRLDHELFQCTIETQTPVIDGPDAVADAVREIREALVDHAAAHGHEVATAGLHPTARWRDLAHATKPRYRDQLDRIRYPQHRNLTSGVHVHVGVDDADAAVWIANELRPHLPPLLALSANSPFWNGFDTGLASARAVIFENLPNTGMPTRFASFEEYHRFERQLIDAGAARDRGELWFDVRPHTELGTVEVRVPDAQRDADRVVAFVRGVAAIVRDLRERYADGESGTDPRREILDANKWRAARHGHDATFLDPTGGTIGLGEWLDQLSDRVGVAGLGAIYEADSGATTQREIHADEGMERLLAALKLGAEPAG
jgi:carboxylate-amine ligase